MLNRFGSHVDRPAAIVSTAEDSATGKAGSVTVEPAPKTESRTFSDTALERLGALGLEDGADDGPTLFLTPPGLHAMLDAPYLALPEVKTRAGLTQRIRKAADELLALPAPGTLLLGGAHNEASTLALFHAAIDLCRTRGFLLCIEPTREAMSGLDTLRAFLLADPRLRALLGPHALSSRKGQEIAWDYVRASGDRRALQRYLPEVLAWHEIVHHGPAVNFIDPLGLGRGSDTERENVMCDRLRYFTRTGQRAVAVISAAFVTPVQVGLEQCDVRTRSVTVFDDMANTPGRLHDLDPGLPDESREAAHTFLHNLHLPGWETAAAKSDVCRVGADFHPIA